MPRTFKAPSAERYESGRGRLAWTVSAAAAGSGEEAAELSASLSSTPKRLPCRLFYDELGSQLFERICELPEYYLTRTEQALLARTAPEIAALTGASDLVELGSGSASKTRLLLDAYAALGTPLSYAAIDVSPSSLRAAAARLLARYAGLEVHAVVGTYETGLAALAGAARPRLVLFLGSTIGNLTPAETGRFLGKLRGCLAPGDWLLVGTDLEKDPAVIEAAYNDSQGVTAAFNLNILRHVNRRFRGDFALARFAHRAFYDRARRQIEMHLESLEDQRVGLAALDFEMRLARGETIETEISRKFDLAGFGAVLAECGLGVQAQWTDARDWFGLTLARAL